MSKKTFSLISFFIVNLSTESPPPPLVDPIASLPNPTVPTSPHSQTSPTQLSNRQLSVASTAPSLSLGHAYRRSPSPVSPPPISFSSSRAHQQREQSALDEAISVVQLSEVEAHTEEPLSNYQERLMREHDRRAEVYVCKLPKCKRIFLSKSAARRHYRMKHMPQPSRNDPSSRSPFAPFAPYARTLFTGQNPPSFPFPVPSAEAASVPSANPFSLQQSQSVPLTSSHLYSQQTPTETFLPASLPPPFVPTAQFSSTQPSHPQQQVQPQQQQAMVTTPSNSNLPHPALQQQTPTPHSTFGSAPISNLLSRPPLSSQTSSRLGENITIRHFQPEEVASMPSRTEGATAALLALRQQLISPPSTQQQAPRPSSVGFQESPSELAASRDPKQPLPSLSSFEIPQHTSPADKPPSPPKKQAPLRLPSFDSILNSETQRKTESPPGVSSAFLANLQGYRPTDPSVVFREQRLSRSPPAFLGSGSSDSLSESDSSSDSSTDFN